MCSTARVYDLGGGRLARVSDVQLRLDDGDMTVAAVGIGIGSICRRLGLGRIAGRLGDDVVLWPDLHLLSPAGHVAQLTTEAAAVHHLDAAALAHLLIPLPPAQSADIWHRSRSTAPPTCSSPWTTRRPPRLIDAMPGTAATR